MRRVGVAMAAVVALAGCGVAVPPRPSGSAAPDPASVDALDRATSHCRPLRTATVTMRLSGRAGSERLGARLAAGFAEPASVRLEVLAPFGPPAMLLASDGRTHTLLFPRDRQVLQAAAVADVLDALIGLALDAAELRLAVFGCLRPIDGRGERFGDAWQVVSGAETRVFLRRGMVVAADHRGWQIDYAAHEGGVARHVRLRRVGEGGAVDLAATLSDLSMNVDLDPTAFALEVPAGAEPVTLDDLRRASPLRAR